MRKEEEDEAGERKRARERERDVVPQLSSPTVHLSKQVLDHVSLYACIHLPIPLLFFPTTDTLNSLTGVSLSKISLISSFTLYFCTVQLLSLSQEMIYSLHCQS